MDLARRKFKIFALLRVEQLTPEQKVNLAENIETVSQNPKWWYTLSGLRYSLTKCHLLPDGNVIGLLSQQYHMEQNLYSDDKENKVNEIESYEDRIFVLNLNEGFITIEWRKFYNRPELSLSTTQHRIEEILNDLCQSYNIQDRILLAPYERETDKEEFLSIFYEDRFLIQFIAVERFGTESVPSDVTLVNPNIHLEGAARELIEHDRLHPSIEKFVAEARKDGISDLTRSAFVRSALHSGIPTMMRYQDRQSRAIKIRNKNEKGELYAEIPVPDTYNSEDMLKVSELLIPRVNEVDRVTLTGTNIGSEEPPPQLNLFNFGEIQGGDGSDGE